MPSSLPSPPAVQRRRLSRSGDFDSVYRRGRSVASRHLVLYAFSRDSDAVGPRLGLSVSRKVGDAVARNRVKRVLREEFAAVAAGVDPNMDIVLIARPGVSEYLEQHGGSVLGERLSELVERIRTPAAS